MKFEKLPDSIEEDYLPPNVDYNASVDADYLTELSPDIMKEKAIVLLGTLVGVLESIEGLKIDVAKGDLETEMAVKVKRRYKKLIEDNFNSIDIMLKTGKINIEEIISFTGEENQKKLKDLIEMGVDKFLVINNLN